MSRRPLPPRGIAIVTRAGPAAPARRTTASIEPLLFEGLRTAIYAVDDLDRAEA